ncbi:MAG: hypothetical protein A2275_10255 [Bacteroidetes bacterium RIFOXYA12_FULL_35_11]|nr:MAG: hypothetical protein A2X01_10605 [Bacteroidetes bacterium GWF2_35_48]OFY74674.1 MAG: hypothetical protein A2275_10255 [Bacteroidetes bacterium RIFOXYA12_FULL_35_11]OFZ02216.1 MAG: hypothetical protein A2491_04565 [Bacteroidetes bacterium RIFOXYC12_FULL_35_7]HBX49900.1 hypothetical protein [Bacteroidales bacterium]
MGCKEKILIVDDHSLNIEYLSEILSELKVQTLYAMNGAEALKIAEENELALIYMDVQMPKINGFEVTRLLKSNPKTKDIPIIILTAVYTDDPKIKEGYEAGAADFIVKPFNPFIILSKTKVFLNIHKQNNILENQKSEILRQKKIITEKNQDWEDSLRYAKRIQHALTPPTRTLSTYFDDYFILLLPKDIVSGDFYWIKERMGQIYIVAADCTGHGVPGALLSILGQGELEKATEVFIHPYDILNHLNDEIHKLLNKKIKSSMSDGMDLSLCCFDKDEMSVEFSGACNSIYHVHNSILTEYKGTRIPIGTPCEDKNVYSSNFIDLQKGDIIYMFTDGYADQFGGSDNKKLNKTNFKNILTNIHGYKMDYQKFILEKKHNEWKGQLEQIDDILVIGLKV